MTTLKRLIELRFDRGIKIYMSEQQYSTLYQIDKDDEKELMLYFDGRIKNAPDPTATSWIDTANLKCSKGIYYDPETILPSGLVKGWFSPDWLITFAIRDSKDESK